MTTWHEDDAFWARFADFMFTPERMASAAQDVAAVLARLGVARGARVLDLACGPGRHSVELARRGMQVTGVDRTEGYLERARAAAEAAGVEIELVRSDMRDFVREGTFDAAVNLFTSFGYFEDPADDARVLSNLHESLVPGAPLLIDVLGKEVLARRFRPRDWSRDDQGRIWLEERALRSGWDWIDNTWTCVEDGALHPMKVGHRLYSGAELRAALLSAGFADVRLYGAFDGRPYDHEAERLVALATR